MKINVYHDKFGDEAMNHVAVVDVKEFDVIEDALENAYRLTQNLNHAWAENQDVHAVGGVARSTSVNDFMEVDGDWFRVAGSGFEIVEPDEVIRTSGYEYNIHGQVSEHTSREVKFEDYLGELV